MKTIYKLNHIAKKEKKQKKKDLTHNSKGKYKLNECCRASENQVQAKGGFVCSYCNTKHMI